MVEADERPGADGPRAEEDGRDASCRERQAEHRRCKQSISPARALRSGGGKQGRTSGRNDHAGPEERKHERRAANHRERARTEEKERDDGHKARREERRDERLRWGQSDLGLTASQTHHDEWTALHEVVVAARDGADDRLVHPGQKLVSDARSDGRPGARRGTYCDALSWMVDLALPKLACACFLSCSTDCAACCCCCWTLLIAGL